MLTKACYRHVTKNYCGIPNCGYSHDPGIIAAARDQQIIDLTNAKRDMQAAVTKPFEKQGAKVFKRAPESCIRPSYSHLVQHWTSTLGESMSVFNALLSCPSEFLSTSCDMAVRLRSFYSARHRIWLSKLCSTLVVRQATIAFFHANAGVLKDYLIPCPAERVDLATSNSTQSITQHLVIEARHVDTRGVTRTIKLRFGILEGLRFDVVIRLYAIAINFMDVMQDLLTIQLEHQESQTHSLAMLYGTTPHLLMINSSPTSEVETDDSRSSTPASIPSVQPLSRDWSHSEQFMLRWPCIYCPEQIAQ